MSATDLAGCTVAFVDDLDEIPYFVREVLSRLQQLGYGPPERLHPSYRYIDKRIHRGLPVKIF